MHRGATFREAAESDTTERLAHAHTHLFGLPGFRCGMWHLRFSWWHAESFGLGAWELLVAAREIEFPDQGPSPGLCMGSTASHWTPRAILPS